MADPAAARRLHLILSAADGPVSIDALVASGAWSPATLWALVEEARREGLLVPDSAAGPGQLRWIDAARREAVIAAATTEDFDALLAHPPFPQLVLAGAAAAMRDREFRRAAALQRALVAVRDPSLLPGGEETWIATILDAIRLLPSGSIIAPARLDAAIALAESRGDLRAQAVMLAARGLQWLSTDIARAYALYDRAAEAADALGDPAIRAEVRTYIAASLVFAGRVRDGIAAFEEMLGDVPGDVLDPRVGSRLHLQGATPASELAVLGWAYASVGDFPRALDLLGRMAAVGAEVGNTALQAQGRLFLALTRVLAGELDAARSDAEAAHAYWSVGAEPMFAWFAALILAALRAADGALEEARRLLDAALPAWHACGQPWIGGSRTLELIERLETAGHAPSGLGVQAEIERHVDGPQPVLAGVALRFRARRLLAAGGPDAAERAAADLDRAVRLLETAETRPELRLALADAAALAEAQGRADDAIRLRSTLAGVDRSAPSAPGDGRADVLRLANVIIDLGRLGALPRREGLWGDVAARLCSALGAERCAILEVGNGGPVLLSARGAPSWQEAILERVRSSPPREPAFEPALLQPGRGAGGQLVLVPFTDEELGRRGFVVLENRDTPARIGPEDASELRVLGRQIGILMANVSVWRELLEARRRLEQENRYYRDAVPAAPLGGGRIVGGSPAMREVLDLVARVAPSTTPVLVTGETGVGKELVSREVHQLSPRRRGPFIVVHVAALAPGLVASALFGHERGAFTGATEQARGRFELADGGTIFLDEIGELSAEDQVRLLRVLQEGTLERVGGTRVIRSDFRLVAATNRDLAAEVRAGRFREDLYFRLAAFPIRVPSLRERPEEIPTLALYFMERAARKLGVSFAGIAEADMARLLDYPWPGNVRELEHVMQRAVLLSQPPRFQVPPLDTDPRPPRAPVAALAERDEWVTLEEMERRYIRKVLRHVGGKVNGARGAAEVLGLKPSTLQFWIDKLGLREDLSHARRATPSLGRGPRRG